MSYVLLHKFNLHDLSIAQKFHILYSTKKHGPCARCCEEIHLSAEFYECLECNIFFHKECIESTIDIYGVEEVGGTHQGVKLDERGKSIAHFKNEHHHLLFPKFDDLTTRYDAYKFEKILQNYSKPIEPGQLFECLPNNLRPSSGGEGSGERSDDPHHKSLENTIFTIPTMIISMVLPHLHDLAQHMVQAGHQQQLFKTYRDIRGTVLEQNLQKLGAERFRKKDVQRMKWKVLEAKVVNWMRYMRISVKLLFAMEKKIFDQIFNDVVAESLKDQSFAQVIANNFDMLLSFGEAITKRKRSPENLFVLLDMYELMIELKPEFELIFGSKACSEIKKSAVNMTKRLAQTAHDTFLDFEVLVETDATKTLVMDGSIHPLTSYVVNYLKFLFSLSEQGNYYQSTLTLFFQEFDQSVDHPPHTKMKSMIMRIIQALRNNLDGKSKQYKDEALTQLFLMNNVYYIVRSVRRSEEAYDLLGDDWVQRHRRIVQQHANQYKRVSWAKIFECLNYHLGEEGSIENHPSITKTLVKDKFKDFNYQFEELHQRQCQWSVPECALRESLKLSVSELILPAYKSFLKRFGPMLKSGKNPYKYIRFSLEDVEGMLNELFKGKNLVS